MDEQSTLNIPAELRQIAAAMVGEAPAETLDELVERKRREQGLPSDAESR